MTTDVWVIRVAVPQSRAAGLLMDCRQNELVVFRSPISPIIQSPFRAVLTFVRTVRRAPFWREPQR